MNLRVSLAAIFILVLFGGRVWAAENALIIGYWEDATPPFAIRDGRELKGGIIKEIGDNLQGRLGVNVSYKLLPVKRIERELTSGGIHLDCVTSPIWKESPNTYRWSPVLFKGADRFLVRKGVESNIKQMSDLKGKLVGVYNGYVYHPEIMALFESGEATAVQVVGIEKGIELLLANRIDTMIDFGILFQHQMKEKKLNDQLRLADKHADNFDLMCAYSPKLPIDAALLDRHFKSMVEDQSISKILAHYR